MPSSWNSLEMAMYHSHTMGRAFDFYKGKSSLQVLGRIKIRCKAKTQGCMGTWGQGHTRDESASPVRVPKNPRGDGTWVRLDHPGYRSAGVVPGCEYPVRRYAHLITLLKLLSSFLENMLLKAVVLWKLPMIYYKYYFKSSASPPLHVGLI
eukprot:Gb_37377 [translate_table: standard]